MALPNLGLSVGHRPSTSYLLSHAVIHPVYVPGATHALGNKSVNQSIKNLIVNSNSKYIYLTELLRAV